MADSLHKYFEYVDSNTAYFIEQLKEIVEIPSVSADVPHRQEVVRMGQWIEKRWKELGAEVKLVDIGTQELEGQTIQLPPVVLGKYGNDPNKKTLTIYGHYDVQPALKSDGWDTEPFTLVEAEDGRLIGRGVTDDKGPVLGWLLCVEGHKKIGRELPVNIIFCFEGMEESGSINLEKLIQDEADKWFKGTDYVCISDNYWLGTKRPGLTYGLRGNNYFHIEITGPSADLHSGLFGGTIQEPMTALTQLMSTLVDVDGKILIPGINEMVAPLTEEEKKTYEGLSFTTEDFVNDLKYDCAVHEESIRTLQARWRYPSLSLHGVEGAFYNPGSKTVIPAKVTGKFSIRTVPDMDIQAVTDLTLKYLMEQFAKLKTKLTMKATCVSSGNWWYASPNHPNFVAAAKAIKTVFGIEPEYTREGGSIPITLTFQDSLNCNVLLLPMGAANDGAHSTNEKLDKYNYLMGIKTYGAYLHELSLL